MSSYTPVLTVRAPAPQEEVLELRRYLGGLLKSPVTILKPRGQMGRCIVQSRPEPLARLHLDSDAVTSGGRLHFSELRLRHRDGESSACLCGWRLQGDYS